MNWKEQQAFNTLSDVVEELLEASKLPDNRKIVLLQDIRYAKSLAFQDSLVDL